MDIFFNRKYKYIINDSVENVQSEIQSIINRGEFNLPNNIRGRFKEANQFQLTHKWSIILISWIERWPAYINGRISTEKNKTVINITVRPNSIIVFFFYLILFLGVCEITGINIPIEGPKFLKLLLFTLFDIILVCIMLVLTNGLRKRFERMLDNNNF